MAVELPPETLLERAASNSQIRNRCSCAIRTTWSKHQRCSCSSNIPCQYSTRRASRYDACRELIRPCPVAQVDRTTCVRRLSCVRLVLERSATGPSNGSRGTPRGSVAQARRWHPSLAGTGATPPSRPPPSSTSAAALPDQLRASWEAPFVARFAVPFWLAISSPGT